MNVTYQPEPACAPGQRPQEAPEYVVGTRVYDAVVAGWMPVLCAIQYRVEAVDNGGNTIAAITTDRSSLAWELIDISDIPASLRITPQNAAGDGSAVFEAHWEIFFGTTLRF
jgi:hypothetical protein